jgi:hypothetical protein
MLSAGTLDKRDFLVSQDYSHSEQNNPAIAAGLDGKFAVVWVDYRAGNGDIYCRLYDSGAVEIGDDFAINDDGEGAWQFEPALSSDWYGNYYTVWKDYRNNIYPFDPDIYCQQLDSGGFVGINRNVTVELPDSSHQSPAIGATGWGKTIIAWTDLRNHDWDVYVQSFEIGGNPIGSNQLVNDDNSSTPQHEPDVALSSSGWFVVAWYDRRNGNDDIYLQKFDSSGAAIGTNIGVNNDGTTAKQKFPSVAIGGNGVITVVWADWRNGNYPDNPDVYCQRFDSSLNRLGSNFLVNLDGTQSAQRDVEIAADRMGNACIVWSDSSGQDWDVKGQMVDYRGVPQGGNFAVNLDLEGKQLHPDVALDGHYSYLTWADDRDGSYNIYGRLLQYNDPTLVASPSRVDVSKDKLEPNPDAIKITLTNAGYGELDYQLISNQNWITLSKSSGITPDSFNVSIDAGLLDYGIHQGRIRLIDTQHNDSTAFIPVVITITGPLIDIEPDSLRFKALVEIGPPSSQTIIVNNSGSGGINFDLTTSVDWLTLDRTTGSDGETVLVGCDITSLVAGEYYGYVIASDDGALNSPESLGVSLSLQANMPYMATVPDQLDLHLWQGEAVDDSLRVVNLGIGALDWQAECGAQWFALLSDSGQENEIIRYSIETASLDAGLYIDSIVIRDSIAFNDPLAVPIRVTVSVSDTVVIVPVQAELGNQGQTPFYLHNHNSFRAGVFRIQYDKLMLTVDSVGEPLGGKPFDSLIIDIDQASGVFTVSISADSGQPEIDPGYYHLGDIFITANDSLTGTAHWAASADTLLFYLGQDDGTRLKPVFNGGGIEISVPTDVDHTENGAIPSVFFLGQNSPNPFNGSTSISFGLKRSGPVRLEVYNILGQAVAVIVDDHLQAGVYSANWGGKDAGNRDMASGIYFYRINTPGFVSVKKMIFLK